ncbi:hypothetical protein AAVH_13222 [Aphelenchoides avenae]|nr:hypothetical protein AAVH_13222 [Aphelenchus avenae]
MMTAIQVKKRLCPGANGVGSVFAGGGHLLLRPSCHSVLVFLRTYSDAEWRPRGEGKQVVDVSPEVWRLLNEYDVPNKLRQIFNVHIQATETTPEQVQLMLRGRKSTEVTAMLADPPRKLDVHKRVVMWLIAKGPNGTRVIDIRKRSGALVAPSKDKKSVLLVGPSKATVEAQRIIDECDCIEEFDIDNFTGLYLVNDDAFHLKRLSVETDALISPVPGGHAKKWKAEVVGPRGSVECLKRRIGGLHIKLLRVPQPVCEWLVNPGKGVKCARVKDLDRKFNTFTHIRSRTGDKDPTLLVELVVVAESEADLDGVVTVIDECDCIEEFDIDEFIGLYLISNDAFHQKRLSIETGALISAKPEIGATKWKAMAVGPTESVKFLKSRLDGLCIKRRQIQLPVRLWLTNPRKGAKCARSLELDRKYNTFIHLGPLGDDKNPARMVDLSVVGDREEDVDRVLVTIGTVGREFSIRYLARSDNIIVDKVNVTKLQFEFWSGRKGEEQRHRPHHKLEVATGTCIVCDDDAGFFHVSGTPDCVQVVVERINKTQHIALRTSVVSFAMANYIGRARRPFENDKRQLRLTTKGMQPGAWELRRLYVVVSQGDEAEADKADEDQMRKLDLDEVALEVPAWARLLVGQCREMGESTRTGIGISTDAVYGRVIVDIAGSRSTVKQGMKEVIRRIELHDRYKEGDIYLRRIQGQSVDTDGFKNSEDSKPFNLSSCKQPFSWERLTPERWCYAGRPHGGRPPMRPLQPTI